MNLFIAAFGVGVYAYGIFILGLCGLLDKSFVIAYTVFVGSFFFVWKRDRVINLFKEINYTNKTKKITNKLFLVFFCLFVIQSFINLIGALGPELGFDALWYHLTIPKIYLAHHAIFYIPGGLLYYSVMPKLAEMLYIGGLIFGNEMGPKLIHFSFGLLTCLALYKLQRKFFSSLSAMIGVVIFYSNLVVAWESSSAYIDLIRTFFEIMALWSFVNWWEIHKEKWLWISALFIGFEISTKLLAVGSVVIFSLLIIYKHFPFLFNLVKNFKTSLSITQKDKKDLFNVFFKLLAYWIIALIVPMPWFIFSFINTGNPFFPLFSPYLTEVNNKIFSLDLLSPINFIATMWLAFTQAADPISPLYIIFLPLFILLIVRYKIKYLYVFIYSFLGFGIWYVTSKVEGTRMLMPYLPAFSFLCVSCIDILMRQKKEYGAFLIKLLMFLVVFIACISIGYRFIANKKYIPLIIGKETRAEFLSNNLHFDFGDFYDLDGYFKKNIHSTDKVLLYGFHNLYYVDFPFVDATWLEKNEKFNYIATQKTNLPEQFSNWKLIYVNNITLVKLYRKP